MNRRTYNVLKAEVLELLKKGKSTTSKQVATQLGIRLTNASDCLLRLKKMSLVDREPVTLGHHRGRPHYQYRLNSHGDKRLKYWVSNSRKL